MCFAFKVLYEILVDRKTVINRVVLTVDYPQSLLGGAGLFLGTSEAYPYFWHSMAPFGGCRIRLNIINTTSNAVLKEASECCNSCEYLGPVFLFCMPGWKCSHELYLFLTSEEVSHRIRWCVVWCCCCCWVRGGRIRVV